MRVLAVLLCVAASARAAVKRTVAYRGGDTELKGYLARSRPWWPHTRHTHRA